MQGGWMARFNLTSKQPHGRPMLRNRTPIIILGALAITILMHFQRVILVLVDQEDVAANFGVTIEARHAKDVFLFWLFGCLLLSFNIIWKNKWEAPFLGRKAFNIISQLWAIPAWGYPHHYRQW
jgi:hypothetical protein